MFSGMLWLFTNLIVSPIASTIGHMLYWIIWLIVIGSLAFIIERPRPNNHNPGAPLPNVHLDLPPPDANLGVLPPDAPASAIDTNVQVDG